MKFVLMVEDNALIGAVYKKKFSSHGLKVEIASSGVTALDSLLSNSPDLIILDLMLPDMDGMQLLKTIRAMPEKKNIPVIVFSNAFNDQVLNEAKDLGVVAILTKGQTRPQELVDLVSRTLGTEGQDCDAPTEESLKAELRQKVLASFPTNIGLMKEALKSFFDGNDLPALNTLFQSAHALAGNTGLAGLTQTSRLLSALEAYTKTLHSKPSQINFSSDRTIKQAIDFLTPVFENIDRIENVLLSKRQALVVDDQEIALRAISVALEKVGISALYATSAADAQAISETTPFGLILLDVEMPDMNGWDLCSHIRMSPIHRTTPIIFVTTHSDIGERMESAGRGGDDFIAKPFLNGELALKALVWQLKTALNADVQSS